MSDVTEILHRLQAGEPSAGDELLEVIYDELRRQARATMARERQGDTLQGTALVHEVYLRLFQNIRDTEWQSRAHFFGAVAEVMRRILVERARAKLTQKRGGEIHKEHLDFAEIEAPTGSDQVLAIHEALDKLAAITSEAAQLVKLRFFVGYTIAEAAELMSISPRQANRLWAYAKAWLSTELKQEVE